MSDTAFGYHAVESLIRREPRRVATLQVQADRGTKRMQAICELARNQGGSPCVSCAKSELDALGTGAPPGCCRRCSIPRRAHEAAGMMSEADLMERRSQVRRRPCY